MLIFTKIKYNDVPEALAKRIVNWSDKEIQIDDTGLSRVQLQKIIEYLTQEGYKET